MVFDIAKILALLIFDLTQAYLHLVTKAQKWRHLIKSRH